MNLKQLKKIKKKMKLYLFTLAFLKFVSSQKPAEEIADELIKQFAMRIPQSDSTIKSTELTTSWFVEYKKRPQTDKFYDPYITAFTVMIDGIYYKKFEETWKDIDIFKHNYKFLDTAFKFETENQATATYSAGNDSIVVVAQKDLKVKVFDFRFLESGKPKLISTINALNNLTKEDDFIIKSIWKIPYSSKMILSANRYELIKFDYLTGEKEIFENKLGPIRFIVGPLETDNPEREPYNPKNDRSHIPQYLRNSQELKLFIATGDSRSMNFIGDWSTMQPLYYFDIGLLFSSYVSETEVDFRISSITFYGYDPRWHFYVIMVEGIRDLIFYNAFLKDWTFTRENFVKSRKIKWINGTEFILGWTNLDYFQIFSPSSLSTKQFFSMKEKQGSGGKVYGVSFDLELGREIEEEWKNIDKLERVWAMIRNDGVNLNFDHFKLIFDECYDPNDTQGWRIYGRYRNCNQCGVDYLEKSGPYQGEGTYLKCRKRSLECGNGVYLSPKFILFGTREIVQMYDTTTNILIEGCRDRYSLSEREKPFNIDNGCPPGYFQNFHGSCQKCLNYNSICSVCNPLSSVCTSFNHLNYTLGKINEKKFIKGYGDHPSYWTVIFQKKADNLIRGTNFNTIILQTKFPRFCYFKGFSTSKTYLYKLSVRNGYYLERAQDVGIDISRQKEPEEKDPLNTFVCLKPCKLGFYYDYQSLSCRRCSYGCAKCQNYEECDLCIAGMNTVLAIEEDKKKGIWGRKLKNKCSRLCNTGWFRKAFDGKCYKCEVENCLECEDFFGSPADRRGLDRSSFCTKCELNQGFILDILFGNCTKKCEGFGRFPGERENGVKICDYCEDVNCEECEVDDRKKCIKCKSELKFDDQKEMCVKEKFNIELWAFVGFFAAVFLFILVFAYFLILENENKKKKRVKKERREMENFDDLIEYDIPDEEPQVIFFVKL